MGGIADEYVEWAAEPPKTQFNVAQSFALFSTVA
jgi:hypothetical protein